METKRRKAERKVGRDERDELMGAGFGGEIHAPRSASLRDGGDGVLQAASLGVRASGHGLAVAHGLAPRQALQPVDRLLSTPKRRREAVARCWVRCVVAERKARCVNVDGTEFADSAQAMIGLGPQTEHGRRTPRVWTTVTHAALKGQRNTQEDALLGLLTAVRPKGVRGTVVADRGCSDSKLDRFLKELGVASIMRCRRMVSVESAHGERRNAQDWRGADGRIRGRRGARVTAEGQPVPMVVCVQQQQMQEPWRLARRRSALQGTASTHRYGTRCTVDETFSDVTNPRLGLGRKHTVRERNDRRDALFRLAVLAHTLLTVLGKAGEELGMDRGLGATRPRQYSRVRQGQMLFDLIPTMERKRLRTLLQRFGQLLRAHALLSQVLGYL